MDPDRRDSPSARKYPRQYERLIPALLPAFGGAFSRFGVSGVLYVSELLGAILLFAGFVRATTPMGGEAIGEPEPAT